jgi:hypothetical protein
MKLLLHSPIRLSCNIPQMWTEGRSVTVYSRGHILQKKLNIKKLCFVPSKNAYANCLENWEKKGC